MADPKAHSVEATRPHDAYEQLRSAFDASYYEACYPDVAASAMDPLEHYISFGWQEGRNPSPDFDTRFYLRTTPDARQSGINPLWHYLSKGQAAGRSTSASIRPDGSGRKILFVGHSANRTGAEVVLLDIVRWFHDRTQYDIDILLLRDGPLVNEYSQCGRLFVLESSAGLKEDEHLGKFLRSNYDLIYLNTVVSGVFGETYSQKYSGTPLVMHVHELGSVIRKFEDAFSGAASEVDLFIAASKPVEDVLVRTYGIERQAIAVHNSFVSDRAKDAATIQHSREEARKLLNLNANDTVIMGVGSIDERKGTDIFLDTVARIHAEKDGTDIKFVWIGGGANLAKAREEASARGLSECVTFTGYLANANTLISAADVFFLSSREDPFPLVCLEAGQFGIPTICFGEGTGITAYVDADLVLESISAQLAADAILKLVDDPVKRSQLGSAARATFLRGYSTEIKMRDILCEIRSSFGFAPPVSVIIPNYNHEKYLDQRITSVAEQSFQDVEILILDDASTDRSLDIIGHYRTDPRLAIYPNTQNSGSPFNQWKKGAELASADVVWIAESDDYASENFLQDLLSAFSDDLVNLAISRTEIVDRKGEVRWGSLKPYFDQVCPDLYKDNYKRDGFREVELVMGAICSIVNASGALMRRSALLNELDAVSDYRMCGDWRLYLGLLSTGKIVYRNSAINFFRRHGASVVHKLEGSAQYFRERQMVSAYVVENFSISPRCLRRMFTAIDHEWQRFSDRHDAGTELSPLYDKAALQAIWQKRSPGDSRRLRIGFYVHGILFSKGGIERIAAELANYLVSRGHEVTIYCRKTRHSNPTPVYGLYEGVKIEPAYNHKYPKVSGERLRALLLKAELDVFVPMLSEWLFEHIIDIARSTGTPIIASEHNDPWKIEELWWSKEARVAAFSKADAIHLLSDAFLPSLPENLQDRTVVIPNWANTSSSRSSTLADDLPVRIISVGRLEPQKRVDRLISAANTLVTQGMRNFRIDIFGDGQLREELETLIKELDVASYVKLHGISHMIEQEFARSHIFALPSEFEGFPRVVLEAATAGLPIIACDSIKTVAEMVRTHGCGLCVPAAGVESGLAGAIRELMDNPAKWQELATRARAMSAQYEKGQLMRRWEGLLHMVASQQGTCTADIGTTSNSV
jgi:glycosyltransferase involved in cell wall biosynthesis